MKQSRRRNRCWRERVQRSKRCGGISASSSQPCADWNLFCQLDSETVWPSSVLRVCDGCAPCQIRLGLPGVFSIHIECSLARSDFDRDVIAQVDAMEDGFDRVET